MQAFNRKKSPALPQLQQTFAFPVEFEDCEFLDVSLARESVVAMSMDFHYGVLDVHILEPSGREFKMCIPMENILCVHSPNNSFELDVMSTPVRFLKEPDRPMLSLVK
jgi:hypothetical protein